MADNKKTTDPVAEIAERALKKTSIVRLEGWNSSDQRYIFIAPYDCKIDRVTLLSDTAVSASDTNFYSLQVRNISSSKSLLDNRQTTRATGGSAIVADTAYVLAPDQNEVMLEGEVLELQIIEGGSAADLASAQVLAAVDYT